MKSPKVEKIVLRKVKYSSVEMKNMFKEQCASAVLPKAVFPKWPTGSSLWPGGVLEITLIRSYSALVARQHRAAAAQVKPKHRGTTGA